MYGSVPHNESNCVIEGRQIALNFIIYNPRDNFTNWTVRWFRNDNMSRATLSTEELTHNQSEYILFQVNASNLSLANGNINCSAGPLYRDIFILFINNFSSDKNGYYWCQIVVNNSISQLSQYYAWFYAANSSSCTQQHHFKLNIEPKCAYFVHDNQAHATAPEENISHTTTTFSEVRTTITTLKLTSTVTTSEVMSTLTTPEVTSTVTTPEVATTQTTESVTRSNVSITSI